MSETTPSRDELERRIAARLAQLDAESLRRLDAISAYAVERARPAPLPISGASEDPAPTGGGGVSRRNFLVGAGATGLVLAGTAAGGALIGSALVSPEAEDLKEQLKEMLKMRALIALYEELEKSGLDGVVTAAVQALGASLDLTKNAAGAVSAGIKAVDAALANFERLFPLARQAVRVVEGLVSALAKAVRDAQQAFNDATGGARPITDALGAFFNDLLDKIPFGVGANVKTLINNIVALIAAVPAFIDNINAQLIAPLRTDWFSDDDTKGLKGNLLEPVRKNLLQPADALVAQTGKTADDWQKTVSPVNRALAQRAEVRKQIVDTQAGRTPTPTR